MSGQDLDRASLQDRTDMLLLSRSAIVLIKVCLSEADGNTEGYPDRGG
jgi:hypothetical protein